MILKKRNRAGNSSSTTAEGFRPNWRKKRSVCGRSGKIRGSLQLQPEKSLRLAGSDGVGEKKIPADVELVGCHRRPWRGERQIGRGQNVISPVGNPAAAAAGQTGSGEGQPPDGWRRKSCNGKRAGNFQR